MKILVARIPEEGSYYKGDDPGSIIELDSDSSIQAAGDVGYDLYAQHVSEELIVRGKLDAPLNLRCARCSEFFSTSVAVSDFLRAYPAPEGVISVDITEDMREEILLHIPGFPLCDGECKGVCAQCGADQNKGACDCATSDGPNPWSALDGIDL